MKFVIQHNGKEQIIYTDSLKVIVMESERFEGVDELHANFTDEGLILDVIDTKAADPVIGTSSEMYDDIAVRLCGEADPPEHACDWCGRNVENGDGHYRGDDRICNPCDALADRQGVEKTKAEAQKKKP